MLDSLNRENESISFYIIDVSNLTKDDKILKEDPIVVRKMVKNLNVKIPILMDRYGKTAEKYDALILPKTVVINKNGKIVYNHTGHDINLKAELNSIFINMKLNEK
jgi:hypothetical protein